MKFNHRRSALGFISLTLIGTILGTNLFFLKDLRERTLQTAETNLARHSLTLAEHADQSFRSVDLVLSSVADYLHRRGVTDATSYRDMMSDVDTHLFLSEKVTGLPQIDALTMIDARGKLINFSRYFPVPDVDISDRDYFRALKDNASHETFISAPVLNRGSGTWNVYLARRLDDPNGHFMGLLLGAMSLQYIENFFGTTSLGSDNIVSLVREDEILLARFPHSEEIGKRSSGAGQRTLAAGGILRERGSHDQGMRLRSAKMLPSYPVAVVVTQTEQDALRSWHEMALLMGAMSLLSSIVVLVSAFSIAHWWKKQELLVHASQAADAAKLTFMAMMSHEIRTPMNAVLGLSTTLLDSDLNAGQRDSVKAIFQAGDNLLEILNDILDFSKLESGQLLLETIAFAADDVVQNALSIIGPRATAKGLAILSVVDPTLPAALLGDSGRIRQIIMNLVSNAVKFTESGEVIVYTRCIGRDDEYAVIEWAIADTGIGIAADKIGSLFGDFVQADNSISRRFGGSGLGLAICKRLVEQMDGQIKVVSKPQHGSTFSFSLRLRIAEKIEPHQHDDRALSAQLAGRIAALGRALRILIVDDNATNRFVATKMLEEFDIQINTACNGIEAVTAARRFSYDLVLMDIRMPEMDGLQATRIIRSTANRSQHIPIIAFTANAFAEDLRVCLDAGMNGSVAKPVRRAKLLEAILQSLSQFEADHQTTVSHATPLAPEEIDSSVAGQTRGGSFQCMIDEIGEDSANEMLALFIAETSDRLKRLRGLSPDLDRPTIGREAHSLKSGAATFDVLDMAELSQSLERDAATIGIAEYREILEQLGHCFESFLQRRAAKDLSAGQTTVNRDDRASAASIFEDNFPR